MIDQETIDITQFDLRPHVEDSLEIASRFAERQTINAGHVLKAVLISEVGQSSRAFKKLNELVNFPDPISLPPESKSKVDLTNLSLDPGLAISYSAAESIWLSGSKTIWGRDLITLAPDTWLMISNHQSILFHRATISF